MLRIGTFKSLKNDTVLLFQKIQLPSSKGFTWLQY